MRVFFDIETAQMITDRELLEEYFLLQKGDPSYMEITFEQYINNCLTINNGTLEEV